MIYFQLNNLKNIKRCHRLPEICEVFAQSNNFTKMFQDIKSKINARKKMFFLF